MEKLVIYVTTQTHSLGLKAGLILGIPVYAFPVREEDNFCLRGEDVSKTIEKDKAEGKHPFVISESDPPRVRFVNSRISVAVATVGTTSSGAIDNIDEIGETRES